MRATLKTDTFLLSIQFRSNILQKERPVSLLSTNPKIYYIVVKNSPHLNNNELKNGRQRFCKQENMEN